MSVCFLDSHVGELDNKTKTLKTMYFNKAHVLFTLYLSISNRFSFSSVFFERKTNLQFNRERSIVPVFVRSLSECAMQCVFKIKCVFFSFTTMSTFFVNRKENYLCLLLKAMETTGCITVRTKKNQMSK